jgi:4-hydroxy-tetrahydrodipicolinate synthase
MLVTPFEANGRVDLRTLAQLVHAMQSWGLAAISALGFGGEALALDRPERAAVVRTVVGEAGRLPAIIGCTAATLHETFELTRDAADLGAAAVMIAPPTRERVGGPEMVDAYVKLAQMVQPVNVMIQDAPRWSEFALSAQLVSEVQCRRPT